MVASISADFGKSSVLDLSNPLGFDAQTSSNLAQRVALFALQSEPHTQNRALAAAERGELIKLWLKEFDHHLSASLGCPGPRTSLPALSWTASCRSRRSIAESTSAAS
ncbi:MAG TPA: hypothetical protein VFJ57_11990 [Solirubrobacterales bacterium]|nr:hypothetical protein [Solirubrobacterales bacterium]